MTAITAFTKVGNTKNPQKIAVLLHGYGSNGENMSGIAEAMHRQYLPDTLFLLPDAPHPFEGYAGQPQGYQWFSLASRDPVDMKRGIELVLPALVDFIGARLVEFELTPDDLAVIGFSQGTMLGLYYALQNRARAMVGYSGALIAPELRAPHCRRFLLVHGTKDDVVLPTASRITHDYLNARELECDSSFEEGVGHTITAAGIKRAGKFLSQW